MAKGERVWVIERPRQGINYVLLIGPVKKLSITTQASSRRFSQRSLGFNTRAFLVGCTMETK
jgi:hypothetical protein